MIEVFEERNAAFWRGSRYVLRATLRSRPCEPALVETVQEFLWSFFDEKVSEGDPPAAVSLFIYDTVETANRSPMVIAELAPDGDWSQADKHRSRSDFRVTVDIQALYDQPSVIPVAKGERLHLASDKSASATAEDWSSTLFVIPAGSAVEIIDQKRFSAGGDFQYVRLNVRYQHLTGWIDYDGLPSEPSDASLSDEDWQIEIVWDPDLLTPEEYKVLVRALGDVVRSSGGVGLKLAGMDGFRSEVKELVV